RPARAAAVERPALAAAGAGARVLGRGQPGIARRRKDRRPRRPRRHARQPRGAVVPPTPAARTRPPPRPGRGAARRRARPPPHRTSVARPHLRRAGPERRGLAGRLEAGTGPSAGPRLDLRPDLREGDAALETT